MKNILIVGAALAVGVLSVIATSELSEAKSQTSKDMKLISPHRETITKSAMATGRITPKKEVQIKSLVSGVVEKIYVERGDFVAKGDAIAKIKLVPDAEHLNAALFEVELAEQRAARSSKELIKHTVLFDRGMLSETAMGEMKLQNSLYAEQLESAKNRVNLIKGDKSNNEVELSNVVTATIDGTILDLPVKEGFYITKTNTFSEGTTLAFVADMKELVFEGMVDEFEVGSLNAGMNMHVSVAVFGSEVFQATLKNISLRGELDQGVIKYRVEAKIQDVQDFVFRSGYSANAEIVLAKRENVIAINEDDILFEKEGTYVEVLDDSGNIVRTKIRTGISNGISVEVIEGLDDQSIFRDL